MDKKRVTIKKRKLRKKNIFFLIIAGMLVLFVSVIGYAYWQYESALSASEADVGSNQKLDIEFNGVKDKFGNINVLLLGVDSRGEKHPRSDSIMIAQYDQETKTPKIVSIMRDSYVNIPGYGMNKINAAEALGGPELMRKTIKENFDVDIQYYAQIDFKGFTKMIDKAFPDGIEVDVEKDMSKNIGVSLSQGKQTLHGKELLGYVRFRHDAEGDFGRVNRQQEVIKVLAENIISFTGITHFPQMVGTIQPYIDTNVEERLVLSVATSFIKEDSKIETLRIPVNDGYRNTRVLIGGDNAAVLELDLEKNREALKSFLKR
ncbi:transcriptional regulator [Virgibacillus pantothenticus]|uniref:Regulatory protein MsrR n=1 Tax=Virgibacillus pantothenticus TaxID=1473 RepID=A0A0L0QN68_VIRPA|nr:MULTISPECIES: LCP family protein [Virgibacillus]API93378.1 transcriptional regulator [Virgibacillus sp. 6R]KNE19698.1 transcriptional regulator [Virgibacillus pantothenticus]MBS7428563.1 LCP family protein [Virgibacillus sp. 19R1-5]MBU8567621.1 LCP family protein [Virgibacillus pantothenticus]MBU8601409.1 LCP family protein [Virgibacillus pantothenticus]